jgi:hypothetical protein
MLVWVIVPFAVLVALNVEVVVKAERFALKVVWHSNRFTGHSHMSDGPAMPTYIIANGRSISSGTMHATIHPTIHITGVQIKVIGSSSVLAMLCKIC